MNTTLKIQDGYWFINEKPISKSSIAKKNFFAAMVRMRFVKTEIAQESSFKNRAEEIKEKFNHKFANRKSLSLDNYPNIEKLIFEPKI